MSHDVMRAVRFHEYGGPEVLVVDEVPTPRPQPGQVLVRLVAAGVNPADTGFRTGYFKEFFPIDLPWIPGVDGAGIVEAVGEGVTQFHAGQAVFGRVWGSYAEYAAVPATDLQRKPANLTFEQAATVAQGALTAWQAVETANIQPNQRVLIQGAAGGVGSFAVQLALLKGAHVIGTASTANVELVRSLGAQEVIDYNAVQVEDVVHDVDAVIDTVGGPVIERSWQVLRPDGILVTVAGRLTPEQGQAHGVRAVSVGPAPTEKLKDIAELLEAKRLKPVVGAVFALAEARQAHELSQTRHGHGRIILLTA